MEVIVDRMEGDYIIVEIERGKMSKIPLELIPNVKEGDIISITVNKDKTKDRKKNIDKLMNSLFE